MTLPERPEATTSKASRNPSSGNRCVMTGVTSTIPVASRTEVCSQVRKISRPVTPYYVMISTTLQPELSAALVKVKSPARSVVDARRRLDFFLRGLSE